MYQVDKGVKELFGAEDNEVTTQGLDDLDKRCKQYKVTWILLFFRVYAY